MASEVSICNRALQILGADPITALSESNDRSRALTIAYSAVRDAELERRNWRFAIKRDSLAALADTPIADYAYQYQVPNDFLRLIHGGDLVPYPNTSDYRGSSDALWSREGDRILTDLGAPLSIRYIAKITDVSMYSPSFCEALAARIAVEIAERLTQSSSKKADAMAAYKQAIREATKSNAFDQAPESIGDGSWVTARLE